MNNCKTCGNRIAYPTEGCKRDAWIANKVLDTSAE